MTNGIMDRIKDVFSVIWILIIAIPKLIVGFVFVFFMMVLKSFYCLFVYVSQEYKKKSEMRGKA